MKKIVIYGAGGLGRGILEVIKEINKVTPKYEILGFIDDNRNENTNGYSIFGNTEKLINVDYPLSVVIAIGQPDNKKAIYKNISVNKYLYFPNIIDPSISFSEYNSIGVGNIITKGVSLSTNINLGNFNLIHFNSSIGHDVRINNFNSVYPLVALSGYVSIDSNVDIGANATILPNVSIGSNSTIGAGAVVTKDLPNNVTAVGVPAKIIKE